MVKNRDCQDQDGEGERVERILESNNDLAVSQEQNKNRKHTLRDDGPKLQKAVNI